MLPRALALCCLLSLTLGAAEPEGAYAATVTKAEGIWAESGVAVGSPVRVVVGADHSVRVGDIHAAGTWIREQNSIVFTTTLESGAVLTGALTLKDDRCVSGAVNLAANLDGASLLEFTVN